MRLQDQVDSASREAGRRAPFQALMRFTLRQQIRCCPPYEQHGSERDDAGETLLTVDVQGRGSLERSLDEYTKDELMEGANAYHSEVLGRRVPAVKRAAFKQLPPVLAVHLKRFEYDHQTRTRHKVRERFEFPRVLDMYPYTVEGRRAAEEAAAQAEAKAAAAAKAAQADGEAVAAAAAAATAVAVAAQASGGGVRAPDERYIYDLKGVIVHSGSAFVGHYYAYAVERTAGGGCGGGGGGGGGSDAKDAHHAERWMCFDDRSVYEWDPSSMESACFGGYPSQDGKSCTVAGGAGRPGSAAASPPLPDEHERANSAYMLFYERRSDRAAEAVAAGPGVVAGGPEAAALAATFVACSEDDAHAQQQQQERAAASPSTAHNNQGEGGEGEAAAAAAATAAAAASPPPAPPPAGADAATAAAAAGDDKAPSAAAAAAAAAVAGAGSSSQPMDVDPAAAAAAAAAAAPPSPAPAPAPDAVFVPPYAMPPDMYKVIVMEAVDLVHAHHVLDQGYFDFVRRAVQRGLAELRSGGGAGGGGRTAEGTGLAPALLLPPPPPLPGKQADGASEAAAATQAARKARRLDGGEQQQPAGDGEAVAATAATAVLPSPGAASRAEEANAAATTAAELARLCALFLFQVFPYAENKLRGDLKVWTDDVEALFALSEEAERAAQAAARAAAEAAAAVATPADAAAVVQAFAPLPRPSPLRAFLAPLVARPDWITRRLLALQVSNSTWPVGRLLGALVTSLLSRAAPHTNLARLLQQEQQQQQQPPQQQQRQPGGAAVASAAAAAAASAPSAAAAAAAAVAATVASEDDADNDAAGAPPPPPPPPPVAPTPLTVTSLAVVSALIAALRPAAASAAAASTATPNPTPPPKNSSEASRKSLCPPLVLALLGFAQASPAAAAWLCGRTPCVAAAAEAAAAHTRGLFYASFGYAGTVGPRRAMAAAAGASATTAPYDDDGDPGDERDALDLRPAHCLLLALVRPAVNLPRLAAEHTLGHHHLPAGLAGGGAGGGGDGAAAAGGVAAAAAAATGGGGGSDGSDSFNDVCFPGATQSFAAEAARNLPPYYFGQAPAMAASVDLLGMIEPLLQLDARAAPPFPGAVDAADAAAADADAAPHVLPAAAYASLLQPAFLDSLVMCGLHGPADLPPMPVPAPPSPAAAAAAAAASAAAAAAAPARATAVLAALLTYFNPPAARALARATLAYVHRVSYRRERLDTALRPMDTVPESLAVGAGDAYGPVRAWMLLDGDVAAEPVATFASAREGVPAAEQQRRQQHQPGGGGGDGSADEEEQDGRAGSGSGGGSPPSLPPPPMGTAAHPLLPHLPQEDEAGMSEAAEAGHPVVLFQRLRALPAHQQQQPPHQQQQQQQQQEHQRQQRLAQALATAGNVVAAANAAAAAAAAAGGAAAFPFAGRLPLVGMYAHTLAPEWAAFLFPNQYVPAGVLGAAVSALERIGALAARGLLSPRVLADLRQTAVSKHGAAWPRLMASLSSRLVDSACRSTGRPPVVVAIGGDGVLLSVPEAGALIRRAERALGVAFGLDGAQAYEQGLGLLDAFGLQVLGAWRSSPAAAQQLASGGGGGGAGGGGGGWTTAGGGTFNGGGYYFRDDLGDNDGPDVDYDDLGADDGDDRGQPHDDSEGPMTSSSPGGRGTLLLQDEDYPPLPAMRALGPAARQVRGIFLTAARDYARNQAGAADDVDEDEDEDEDGDDDATSSEQRGNGTTTDESAQAAGPAAASEGEQEASPGAAEAATGDEDEDEDEEEDDEYEEDDEEEDEEEDLETEEGAEQLSGGGDASAGTRRGGKSGGGGGGGGRR